MGASEFLSYINLESILLYKVGAGTVPRFTFAQGSCTMLSGNNQVLYFAAMFGIKEFARTTELTAAHFERGRGETKIARCSFEGCTVPIFRQISTLVSSRCTVPIYRCLEVTTSQANQKSNRQTASLYKPETLGSSVRSSRRTIMDGRPTIDLHKNLQATQQQLQQAPPAGTADLAIFVSAPSPHLHSFRDVILCD